LWAWIDQKNPDQPTDKDSSVASLAQMAGRPTRTVGYLLITLFTYWYAFPLDKALTYDKQWMALVILRNLLTMCIFFGGWHTFLYGGAGTKPLLKDLADKKLNRSKASYNVLHDAAWSTMGILISSALEIVFMHLFASGQLSHIDKFWDYPLWCTGQLLLVPYWHEFHFYCTHRLLHIPILYKWIHSLHHKSRSPGPWSGLSMHPIEHLVYFSASFTPLLLPLHPIHFLFQTIYSRLSPIAGHDGYDKPAGGSIEHYLHHVKTNVNYGTPVMPMDKWFGTHDDGSEFREKMAAQVAKEKGQ
jgi:sterol desaturase/sphingolipid hydroxylase (fatty acid hydroxylase superfamily)